MIVLYTNFIICLFIYLDVYSKMTAVNYASVYKQSCDIIMDIGVAYSILFRSINLCSFYCMVVLLRC